MKLLNKYILPRIYTKFYSTKPLIQPIVSYNNTDTDKAKIFQDNRGKSGIYCWTNVVNSNTYIGSSTNLSRRFYNYFSLGSLAKSNRSIDRALLKYGFSKFKLDILEYCDVEQLLNREQYYIDVFKPEYNIVEKAGSTLGYKHTEESIAKMRDFILSDEVLSRKKLSTKNATDKNKIPLLIENIETKQVIECSSMTEAGKILNITKAAVSQAFKHNRLIKKTYLIKERK